MSGLKNKPFNTTRLLQIAIAIGCLVPISAGLGGVVLGPDLIGQGNQININFDSHFRYLSGILLAIGLSYLSTIPQIEHQGRRFRLLTFLVFIGGLSRLYAYAKLGIPNMPMLFGLGMELLVTPALAFWQWRVASANPRHEPD
eukprot:gene13272-13378_t